MRLIKVTGHHWAYRARFFADGRPITESRYNELCNSAVSRDCFLTEIIGVHGGFMGFRYSQQVRP